MVNNTSESSYTPILVTGISFEEFLERYDGQWAEWVDGDVVAMSPIQHEHELLRNYLRQLFLAYFDLNPVGEVLAEPEIMRLPNVPSGRAPDLFILLNDNPHQHRGTYLDGPADIVIEIASPGTEAVDRGEKFVEYEQGGVREYWQIDQIRKQAQFYRLNDEGVYLAYSEDTDGFYESPQLARLKLHVPTLWEEELPGFYQIGDAVRAMLEAK